LVVVGVVVIVVFIGWRMMVDVYFVIIAGGITVAI
jgi:hypothetical protein